MNRKTALHAAFAVSIVWLGGTGAASNGGAQTVPAPEAAAPAVAERGEPAVKYTVIEDEGSRIDELRVRGQTQRITVTPKAGGKAIRPYEIIPSTGSQALLEAPNGVKGAAGKRVWHVLSF